MRVHVNIACADPDALAAFYCAALGYESEPATGYYRPLAGSGPMLEFHPTSEPKAGPNRLHLDVVVGPSFEAEATRLEALGATRRDRFDEGGHAWILMLDPEGNEFCVCDA
jgi:catechol 2,3-dioxygenase-like lactoylglutathione lyase family enzyme